MPVYSCRDTTMYSVIAMNYLAGVLKFEMKPDTYDPVADKFSHKFVVNYNQDDVIKEKTLTFKEVQEFMLRLDNVSKLLDTISDDIRIGETEDERSHRDGGI